VNSSTPQLLNPLRLSRRDLLVFALLLVPLWVTRYLPLQDYPDWLLEGRILSRYNSPAFGFAHDYQILRIPIPNLASTIVIGALDRVVPIEIAGKIFLSLSVLLYAASILYLFRSMSPALSTAASRFSPPASRIELIPLLFTYNYFFFVGNLNYLFSLPWLFFALGYVVRRHDAFAWRHAGRLAALALIIYFSHFVSFCILLLGLASIALSKRKFAPRFALKELCALLPCFLLLAIYLTHNSTPFGFTYFYSARYWLTSIVAPFFLFFRFYPVETRVPTLILNGLMSILLLTLFAHLIIRTLQKPRPGFTHPLGGALLALSAMLFALLLFAPANVAGLVRLNQRMALPFLVIFLASASAPQNRRREKRLPSSTALVILLASVIALHTVTIVKVGARMRDSVEAVLKAVPRRATPYVITERFDRSWEGRRPLSRAWNALTPIIYPFDRVAFYHTIRRGGRNVHLFDTSIVRLKEPLEIDTRSSTVGSLRQLVEKVERARPQIAAEFSYVILVGSPASIPRLQRTLLPDYSPIRYAPALCILHRVSE
jgi:hypothetical protein